MRKEIDITTIIVPFIIVVTFCVFFLYFPVTTKEVVNGLYGFVTDKFGWIYLWLTLISFLICIYLAFSKYGSIKLGEGKKEFKEFAWAAMIFSASMASGFLYWTNIEWIYYYKNPPFGIEPYSVTAMEYAGAYPLFHWGPSAWCLYLIPAIAFGYSFYCRKNTRFDIAEPCFELLGKKHKSLINIIFIVGMIGGAATTLAIGTPVTTGALNTVFGIADSGIVRFITLGIITVIFTMSTYFGLEKGVKRLSKINVIFLITILGLIFIVTDREFVIRIASTSVGILISDYFKMSTWMDPVTQSGFTEAWTVFYWAWWLSISLSVGLFIARISKGRTIRQVVLGCIGYGFSMTMLFFSIIGGNSMHLQLSGHLDVVGMLNATNGAFVVSQIFLQNNIGMVILVLVMIASVILTATTYDSVSYTLAMVVYKKLPKDGEPSKKLRIFWALSIVAIPALMMLLGGTLQEIQALTIVFTLPVCFIYIVIMISLIKMLKKDFKNIEKPK